VRVLLVNEAARPHNGGANRVVVETCQLLQDAGHQVLLAYQDSGPVAVDCPTHPLPDGGNPGDLIALCRDWKPDVLQLHGARRPGLIDEAAQFPAAVFLHDQSWFCSSGDRMSRDLQPCHRPHGVSCLAQHYLQGCGGRSPLGNLGLWTRTQGLARIRNHPALRIQVASRFMQSGLLENRYDPARIDLVQLYAPDTGPSPELQEPGLLLLPSRLVPPKGVQVALQALQQIQHLPWRLVIAGDGWHRAALEQLAASLQLSSRVEFIGEIPPTALDAWYRRCQVVLFPVLRHEPFGLVGVEALAHGRPVVAFGGGGAEEWLAHDVSSIRVEQRTPTAFAEALRRVLSSPELLQRLENGTRSQYTPFHPQAYLQRLLASLERAVESFQRLNPGN